jgi:membrane-associated phospholipid phosphatase
VPSALSYDEALGRWSRAVRGHQYLFELVSGLDFGPDGNNAAIADLTFRGRPNTAQDPNPFQMQAPTYETGPQPKSMTDALAGVLNAAALRPDRISEILTQVTNPYAYFSMVLNLQPGRHRYTFELMSALFTLTDKVVMQFKHFFRILRPADRSQIVQPVLLTPSHGSYPAGHAVQSYLVTGVLKKLLVLYGAKPDVDTQLTRLAERISFNRVVAGVHFQEDVDEGQALGAALASYFLYKAGAPTVPPAQSTSAVNWLWSRASEEWK